MVFTLAELLTLVYLELLIPNVKNYQASSNPLPYLLT